MLASTAFLCSVVFCGTDLFAGAAPGSSLNRLVNVSAEIPSELMLEMRIVDQLTKGQVPSMDFGELQRTGDEFRAKTYFNVYLTVNSVGVSSELTQVGTLLTRVSGNETMPSGAYMMKPFYEESQNNGLAIPVGARVAAAGRVAETRSVYSDTNGESRTITVSYTLTGDPQTAATQVIPISQKSGSYSGTITFTLTTI